MRFTFWPTLGVKADAVTLSNAEWAGPEPMLQAERLTIGVSAADLMQGDVRVTEVSPGLVETEFSLVRFDGDRDRAAAVYDRMTPLAAEDVADCICWAATRPRHVNIDEIVVRPRDQASSTHVYRHPQEDD